jgi:hypothetical protein
VGAIHRRRRRLRHTQTPESTAAESLPVESLPAESPAVEPPAPEPIAAAPEVQQPRTASTPRGKPRGKGDPRRPSPYDLAGLAGAFALTSNVQDPEPGERVDQPDAGHDEPQVTEHVVVPHEHDRGDHEEALTERGLRGLVGGGSSQVSVAAAMRARDAARPSDAEVAAAERDLVIVRRGWVPRDDLPRPGRRNA